MGRTSTPTIVHLDSVVYRDKDLPKVTGYAHWMRDVTAEITRAAARLRLMGGEEKSIRIELKWYFESVEVAVSGRVA